jgi:glycosyltransferase involved in cell wall biosynthesis
MPNGIDMEIFKPQPKNHQLMELHKISVQDKVALFVGGLDDQHYFKGVPVLLKAFAQIRQGYFPNLIGGEAFKGELHEVKGLAYLIVIGDGNLRSRFEKLVQELKIADRVIFTGWVKNEQLPDYYNLSDVLILPSTERIESFGIVVSEAQACGKPALVANWPGVRQTISDGETGFLIEPGNDLDLKNKMQKIFDDAELAEKLGAAAIIRTRDFYDWDKLIERMTQLYSRLLD